MSRDDFKCSSCGQIHDTTGRSRPGKRVGTHATPTAPITRAEKKASRKL